MRWIVRDLGIFVYGCIFAGRYIVLARNARSTEKREAKRTQSGPVLVAVREMKLLVQDDEIDAGGQVGGCPPFRAGGATPWLVREDR